MAGADSGVHVYADLARPTAATIGARLDGNSLALTPTRRHRRRPPAVPTTSHHHRSATAPSALSALSALTPAATRARNSAAGADVAGAGAAAHAEAASVLLPASITITRPGRAGVGAGSSTIVLTAPAKRFAGASLTDGAGGGHPGELMSVVRNEADLVSVSVSASASDAGGGGGGGGGGDGRSEISELGTGPQHLVRVLRLPPRNTVDPALENIMDMGVRRDDLLSDHQQRAGRSSDDDDDDGRHDSDDMAIGYRRRGMSTSTSTSTSMSMSMVKRRSTGSRRGRGFGDDHSAGGTRAYHVVELGVKLRRALASTPAHPLFAPVSVASILKVRMRGGAQQRRWSGSCVLSVTWQ